MWTRDRLIAVLMQNDLAPVSERSIDHGTQVTLPQGTTINLYNTGKAIVGGKASSEKNLAQALVSAPPKSGKSTISTVTTMVTPVPGGSDQAMVAIETKVVPPKEVFIVYGHDGNSRNELELLLLRLDIKPIILSNLAPDGKTIIEALIAKKDVPYAIVLLTPDDEGYSVSSPDKKRLRARQNVILELGMFLMKLGRDKVAILHKGDIELPSDINGLIYISFKNSISETKNKLAAALQKAGFHISIEALSA